MHEVIMSFLIILLCLLLTWIGTHQFLQTRKKFDGSNPKKLPPGPRPLPILGNLFHLSSNPHIAWTKLAKTYGPLMTIHLGRVTTVIISSAEMAKEALQKKDLSFSNRRVIDAVCGINHHENSLAFLPVSHKWRNLRKICNTQVFFSGRLDATKSLRKNKVNDLMSYVKTKCDAGEIVDIGHVAFSTTLNVLSTAFFSVDVCDLSSEIASEFQEIVTSIANEMGKPNLVDYFPILRKIDPQGIRSRTSKHFEKLIDFFNVIIEQRLNEMRPTCSMQDYDVLDALLGINNNEKKCVDVEPFEISHLLLELFTAGADTTSTTFEWAMSELLRNPEKLKKAQTELNQVIGKGNPIEESNIINLPYLQAIVKETCRLHPAAPFLLPRKVDSDVVLSDFTVPKNAQVLVNVWAIGRDPNIWENPNAFEPERFLGSEIDVKGRDFELIPFGAGRRICPGLPLAIRVLHLMLASLIHGFDWKLEDGLSPEKMDMEGKFGFTLERAQSLRAIPLPPKCL